MNGSLEASSSTMHEAACKMDASATVLAAIARVNVRLAGMQALNEERARKGHSPGYDEQAFESLIADECLDAKTVAKALETLTLEQAKEQG